MLPAILIPEAKGVRMGKMGCGYGSEFHLLRFLGYHRQALNRAVEAEMSGRVLEWLDFSLTSSEKHHYLDVEVKGLEFLKKDHSARTAWKEFWPQSGNVQNWDAVGRLQSGSQVEYLLVEAKGHVEELESHCGASENGGLSKIRDAFKETINACGSAKSVEDWLEPHYQYANRLSTLYFLLKHNVPARLVFIYFLGDEWPSGKNSKGQPVTCPVDKHGWQTRLDEIHQHLGLTGSSGVEKQVHPVFLHVGGPK